jgi:hypothetical protein
MITGMTLQKDIEQYINYFREKLPEISAIASHHYQKTLYVTLLDCLSRSGFPHLTRKNKCRFVKFINTCSDWNDKDRVSVPQLKLLLDSNGIASGALYTAVLKRLNGWSKGEILRPNSDPTIDELEPLLNADERRLVEKAKYAELLYNYRNHLVHEFRQPGYGMDLSEMPTTPYYHELTKGAGRDSWELVFPSDFLHDLCSESISGLDCHLNSNNINPYDAYEFGTLWQ